MVSPEVDAVVQSVNRRMLDGFIEVIERERESGEGLYLGKEVMDAIAYRVALMAAASLAHANSIDRLAFVTACKQDFDRSLPIIKGLDS